MKLKILSLVLVVLMLTSVTVPTATASASASGFVPAATVPFVVPKMTEMVICGITVIMSAAAAQQIADHFGITWERTQEGWNQLMRDTGKAVTILLDSGRRVSLDTNEGKAAMKAIFECYCSSKGPDREKGKWYIEARLDDDGEIEINLDKRMDADHAVMSMKKGKDIMTLTENHAKTVVGRLKGLTEKQTRKLDFEKHHDGKEGYFKHLHYYVKKIRYHVWTWK